MGDPGGDLSDEEAVARARQGDHGAFALLVARYQGRAHGLATRILKDPERARDAVQDAFLKAYSALDRFEGRSGFYTWLYRLTFNHCIDLMRRERGGAHVEWDDAIGSRVAPGAGIEPLPTRNELAGPARELHRAELREALAQAIESLPDDARRTLVLREVDGLSYAEIAKALRIPKGTVMSRLHYARKKVRETLAEMGVIETADGRTGGKDGEDAA
jgi:RNA polymerase sigma-70 factor (ECF subfamily)